MQRPIRQKPLESRVLCEEMREVYLSTDMLPLADLMEKVPDGVEVSEITLKFRTSGYGGYPEVDVVEVCWLRAETPEEYAKRKGMHKHRETFYVQDMKRYERWLAKELADVEGEER